MGGVLNKLSAQMNVQPRREEARDGAKLLDFLGGRDPAQTVPPDFLSDQVWASCQTTPAIDYP